MLPIHSVLKPGQGVFAESARPVQSVRPSVESCRRRAPPADSPGLAHPARQRARSPRKLLRAVVARLLGRSPEPPTRLSRNRPKRPKTCRRFRRIVGWWSSTRRLRRDRAGHRVFNTPAAADAMLEEVLRDEPDWRDVLYIEPIELLTGGLD